MNKNPSWKYLLLVLIVAFGVVYATPNLFVAEPGVQVIGIRNAEINETVLGRVTRALESENISDGTH